MANTTYTNCLASMFKLQRFGIKLGLDLIGQILAALGNPHQQFAAIHIAGTNGKGSVAAMLATIFNKAGIKVGCYTSPHLERFNERIAINTIPITDEWVVDAYQRVQGVKGLSRPTTFFEFATAMAFDVFARQGVEWAIVETGMGGRLDATNILKPDLAVITNISMEHQDYLGSTLYAIAGEKAGIIKKGIPVITGVRQPAALKAVEETADRLQAQVYRYGKAFGSRRHRAAATFDYLGIDHTYRNIVLGLQGDHQIDNASLVLAACEILSQKGKHHFSEELLRLSLKETYWPGRLEIAGQSPYIILDGAHNLMSARTLGRYLTTHFHNRKITLVIGILDDKPYQSILKDLLEPCQRVVVTQPTINRAIPAPRLAERVNAFGFRPTVKADVAEAVNFAVATSQPDEVICIAGSLYVVGEAKTALSAMGIAASSQ